MTIDEAIAHAREVAIEQSSTATELTLTGTDASKCIKCVEEHEQLVEWLEELKMLRKLKDRNRKIRIIEVFNIGYNKAIDDFVEKSNNMKFADKDAKEIFVERVQEIAEQLKAGVENE